jgi:hypothetical protein
VASITLNEHVASTSLDFVEDLFQSVHDSLGDEDSDDFAEYKLACREGRTVAERIQKLTAALSSAFPNTCKYLILDGYDRINRALQSVIDSQMSHLQTRGLNIMTTRRVPVFSIPQNAACDECDQEELELWWQCSVCNIFWLCYDCKKKPKLERAHSCINAHFEESYLYVSVKLGDFPVESFTANRLGLYHSNLGHDVTGQVISYIKSKAGGNITLALLYLEDIFSRDNFASLDSTGVNDRLPRDVIAFFNAEMNSIEQRPRPQRLPPLLAIAAAAHNDMGISLEKLEECIRLAQQASHELDYPRGVEDVFDAANGWLTDPRTVNREVDICCKPAFTFYVQEDYNDSLAWAKRQIGYDTGHQTTGDLTSPPLLEPSNPWGGTLDTLNDDASLATPPVGTNNALGLFGIGSMTDSPLISGKEARLIQSPPRMNSFEDMESPGFAISASDPSIEETGQSHHPQQSTLGVCNICTSLILNSSKSSGQHQLSALDAKLSAHHCIFCSILYSTESIDTSPSAPATWPLYHWTFRALPRGRALKGSMMLRFWATHPSLESRSFRFLPDNNLNIPSTGYLQSSTDPKVNGGYQIKEWVEACNRQHAGCRSSDGQGPGTSFIPTRVIDVDTGDDEVVRLVDTTTTKVKGPYCTLSHAWGPPEKKFLTTTVWNMAKHLLGGISMNELPPNFQQAIQITRLLKVRYIWIDSLVIVQEPYGDFAVEGDLMHKVYRHSYCNIVAADSADGYGGLFRKRDPHAILPVEYRAAGTNSYLGNQSWTVVPADMWEKELLNSPIYTRGWVFQGQSQTDQSLQALSLQSLHMLT